MNKKKKKKSHIGFRVNVMFFIVFVLFSVLILRIGFLQIVYGEDFKREVDRTEDVTVNHPVPRGKMYDRNGKIVVDNTPLNAITYTKTQGSKPLEMLEVAEKLSILIEKETKKVRERDKKDYWILRNPDLAKEKITKNEWISYSEKKIDDKDLYKLQLERITEEELASLTEKDLEVLAIFIEMNSGYALTPQIVKKGVSVEEFSMVSEQLDSLPGVDTTTDWERNYTYDQTLKTVLGKVTESDEGLPRSQLDYYLSRGYSRNDRVGKSYIEMQYEDVLQGQKTKALNITDKAGNVIESKPVSPGKRGKDLLLTIDMDLQLEVEKIIEEELLKAKESRHTRLLDRAFVVMMNPHTGEVLTMAGKQIAKNEETGKTELRDFALGNITTSYTVGSAIKGATVLTGLNTGAISPGTKFYDTPLKIRNTQVKRSWKPGLGLLDDINALKVSSNIYMFRTAINIGKGSYGYDQPLPLDLSAFDTMRNSFSQFGLGVRTGIDLPNEMVGFKGLERKPGLLLDFSIGQYDTYTPMQLAQYVSTIANGGYRVQPRMVKSIHEPMMEQELGPVIKEMDPVILNSVDATPEWIARVQEGFRRVMQVPGGTAYGRFHTASYLPAGKTGTAQAFYDGPERSKFSAPPPVINLSLVAYAPHDNPEVAMAVMVPWAYESGNGHYANNLIGRRAFDAYFNLKQSRLQGGFIENVDGEITEETEDSDGGTSEETEAAE